MKKEATSETKMSGQNQHTPGPWKVSSSQASPEIEGGDKLTLAFVNTSYSISDRVAQANARLIAAAPDLLAASKKFLAFYNDLTGSNPGFMGKLCLQDYAQWNAAMMELPRAIAKAEGQITCKTQS